MNFPQIFRAYHPLMLYSKLEMQMNNRILAQVGISALLVVLVLAAVYVLFDVKQLQFADNLNKYPGLERYSVVLSGTVSELNNRFIEISEGDARVDLTTNDTTQYAATEHNWDVLSPVAYDSSKISVGEKIRAIGFIEKGKIVVDIVIHLDTQ
ncbi:MAG: hypothetical protein UX31_C0005G0015 [Candidatus Nomurabacteria bacterium GW2011_GWA1_46_11]|uniref:DUF5666 domain-containing protein n=2 Tax=Parcubacteria group TaxID=1794811 RepID=A0A0G1RMR3_9BACT|nr:MAG: hypothetical protein UX29_C0002G0040 [Parcubacteria group bacterium GW2011_GWA2_46_10]KKU22205.1 MAG: hypothetical protein UX31_C0005G0015 [Candidatus Nomurabacteria bacterium GW2011_GWA1_46_11]